MEESRIDLETPIEDAISKIRFAPNSNSLLISSWDSLLRLYDVDASVTRFEAHSEGALLDCCFCDEFTALSASSDGCIRRYDLCSKTQTIVGKHDDSVLNVEYSEQTGQVITAGLDKKLTFWNVQMKNGQVASIKTTDSDVWCLSVSGPHLLAAIGTKLDIYDLRNLKIPVQSKDFSKKYQIWCVCSFSSCQGYAVGSIDGCVDLKYFDSAKDSELGYAFWCHPKSKDRSSHLVAVNDIKFNPLNETFVTGDDAGHAIIWNANSRKRLFESDASTELGMVQVLLKAVLCRFCMMRHACLPALFRLGMYPNSVASLSFNQGGQLLAVASSRTYQEATEIEEVPQIFIHKLEELPTPGSSGVFLRKRVNLYCINGHSESLVLFCPSIKPKGRGKKLKLAAITR